VTGYLVVDVGLRDLAAIIVNILIISVLKYTRVTLITNPCAWPINHQLTNH